MSADRLLVTLSVGELRDIVRAEVQEALASCAAGSPAPCSSLLARSALALALGCSLATVDRMVRDGCPFVVVGRTKRFDLAKVQAWLGTRTIEPAPKPAKRPDNVSLAGVRMLSRRAVP